MNSTAEEIKDRILQAITKAENEMSKAKYSIKNQLDLIDPIKIMPYYGYGNEKYIFIKGRVLEKEKVKSREEGVSKLKHVRNTYKRYETDEIPNILVKASYAGKELEVKTDKEGFFDFEFEFDKPIDYEKHGYEVALELLESKTEDDEMKTRARFFVPSKDAEFGVISDIDDTVLVSQITDFFAKLRLMLLKDGTERSPFPGAAAFLQALLKGADGSGRNALFYVSGSEWNLFDLLVNFFEYREIPKGPLLLKDKGTKGKFSVNKEEYKQERISHILETYPELNFICIGDSGQHDPEIYSQMVEDYPGRIKAIYIRDVTPDKRDKEVEEIARKVKEKGVEMFLIEDTLEAARHCCDMEWINQGHLEEVESDCKKDKE